MNLRKKINRKRRIQFSLVKFLFFRKSNFKTCQIYLNLVNSRVEQEHIIDEGLFYVGK